LLAKFTNQLITAATAVALIIKDSSELAGLFAKQIKDAFGQNAKRKNLP
jgi:Zn-dependent oligopeptidase